MTDSPYWDHHPTSTPVIAARTPSEIGRAIQHELGVPGGDYPQPVANAYELAGRLRKLDLNESDLRAILISLDELEAYVDTVGTEDEAHQRQAWAIRKLRDLLERYGETPA